MWTTDGIVPGALPSVGQVVDVSRQRRVTRMQGYIAIETIVVALGIVETVATVWQLHVMRSECS